MSDVIFREGSELADGRYRLVRRLGSGGMATVWLALDTRLGRQVAIKLPTAALTADETFAIRFEREAQNAAALSHPTLVSVFDYGTEGDRPYLVSEYVDGSNLAELRDREQPPPTEDLARTLLEALAHIHAGGIVHRDIKPGNVLVDPAGRIMLTDFGIAQSTEETSLTATGHVIGTLSYLAPEVKKGQRAGPQADLYSLGVLLSEQLSHEDSDRVARLVDALLLESPTARPASAGQALEMLERKNVYVEPTTSIEDAVSQTEPTATHRARPLPPPRQPGRVAPPPQPPGPGPSGRPSPLLLGLGGLLLAVVIGSVIALAVSGGGGDGGGSDGNAKTQQSASSKGQSSASSTTSSTSTPESTETTTTPDSTSVDAGLPSGRVDPARGVALNNEGFALLQQGDAAGALPKLRRSVASFPADSTEIDYAFALFNYAQALRLTGDPAAAIPLLEKRLSFSDFKVDVVEAELATAKQQAGQG